MAGHSHWKGIQERKGALDKKRAKIFAKLLRGIEVAARDGDPNPDNNPTLADAIQRAKDASVPKDNIERALARASGELDQQRWENLNYEAYAPGGVAMLIAGLTNNRNRTSQDLRAIFRKHGGALAEPGSVQWLFERRGVLIVDRGQTDEETLMALALDAGAEDIIESVEDFEIVTDPSAFEGVKAVLAAAKIEMSSAEITQRPANLVPVEEEDARKILKIIDALEDHDDVQAVYANYDIPDSVFAEA
ncbi:MAG: YebC/PmpR family DNA-binding transcriptional regulator [Actinomycetota bacterium]